MAEADKAETLESVVTDTPEVAVDSTPKVTLEDALKKLSDYEAEATKNADLLKKLRKFEKENKEKAEKEAIEAGKYKELYEAAQTKLSDIETKVRTQVIDGALKDALTEAKARSMSTVMKLVDRSKVVLNEDGSVDPKSLAEMVKGLKVSDPILFGDETTATAAEVRTVVVPPLHKAGEGNTTGGYEKEVRAAKSPQQIEAVMRKYGKL